MPARRVRTPSYRHHRPTGQAVVTIAGRDFYLGRHDTPESHAEYDRLIAEWLASGRGLAPRPAARSPALSTSTHDLTITELVVAYWRFCEGYYRKDGEPTSEIKNIRLALRPLRQLYGHTPARDFGPLALKTVRQSMVDMGLLRTEVNKRVGRIVRAFRWAVENEMVGPTVYQALRAVSGLRKGRCEAPEGEPVRPVPEAHVEAVQPHVDRRIWAMIEIQRLTACRPGEVVIMRTGDIDRSGSVWVYTPARHKTEHRGRRRRIYLGPRAQEVVRPWLKADPNAYLFSPIEAKAEESERRRAARKSPMTPSQRARRPKPGAKRRPRPHYTNLTYGQAITRACAKAGAPHWHAHQLRHNAATWLRREFGLDVARVILGHSSPIVTEIYAEADQGKAMEIMGQVG